MIRHLSGWLLSAPMIRSPCRAFTLQKPQQINLLPLFYFRISKVPTLCVHVLDCDNGSNIYVSENRLHCLLEKTVSWLVYAVFVIPQSVFFMSVLVLSISSDKQTSILLMFLVYHIL